MLCYSRPQLLTHCGLAVLNLQNEYGQPFAKTEFPLPPVTQVMLKTWSRLRPSLLLPAFLFGVCNRRKRVDHVNKTLYFVCCRPSPSVFCGTREEKRPTLSPLASMWISQQVTQIPPTPPLAEFCVPCVPSGTGGTLLSQPSHKTTQAPWLPPESPVWPVSIPGGERPAPPGQRPVRATQGPV